MLGHLDFFLGRFCGIRSETKLRGPRKTREENKNVNDPIVVTSGMLSETHVQNIQGPLRYTLHVVTRHVCGVAWRSDYSDVTIALFCNVIA